MGRQNFRNLKTESAVEDPRPQAEWSLKIVLHFVDKIQSLPIKDPRCLYFRLSLCQLLKTSVQAVDMCSSRCFEQRKKYILDYIIIKKTNSVCEGLGNPLKSERSASEAKIQSLFLLWLLSPSCWPDSDLTRWLKGGGQVQPMPLF